jgi:hypothetical protein
MLRRAGLLSLVSAGIAIGAGCTTVDRNPSLLDSLHAVADQRSVLAARLSAQKDSLTSVVLEADAFIARIDSQISAVRGLRGASAPRETVESPIQEQLRARRELLGRVDALVERAMATAAQLAESYARERTLRDENATLQSQIERDQERIAQLGETIGRQSAAISDLQWRVDSMAAETRALGEQHYRAYYVVGTERELLEKGIVEREGGTNLLVARIGRTIQPARALEASLFTSIDQRDVREIAMPDSTKRYRIVSRQSLDNANVRARDGTTFAGTLRIAEPEKFWAPSRYLILVQN